MRDLADAERLRRFLSELSREAREETAVYLDSVQEQGARVRALLPGGER